MAQTIELLENALCTWEDLCLIDEARIRMGITRGSNKPEELHGPIKHWRELRNHLLTIRGDDFDDVRFCPSEKQDVDSFTFTGKKDMFLAYPLQLASWTSSSRRVFNLSEDLISRFIAADYTHYKWSDLLWPFDSFVINLEKPIKIRNEKGDISTTPLIMISSIFKICSRYDRVEEGGFEVRTFFTAHNDDPYPTEFLPASERERLDDHVRHKRWHKVGSRLARFADSLTGIANKGELIKMPAGCFNPVALAKEEKIMEGSNIAKLIAGLCLYLEALPASTVDAYHWHQPAPVKTARNLRKIITDGEQVCQVNDFNIISPETITLFPETLRQGPMYTVTPHWRRGYKRRARGQGNNPNAPRTVDVLPALIHKDQLPAGAVPGGAQSSVK